MVKKGIWALGAAVMALVLAIALFPLVASTQIVRDRIALEMSAWSGYRVSLGAAPVIDVFPTFKATLSNVTLSDWLDYKRRPVVEAERVEIELSALAALVGNVVFSDVRLVRPTLRVVPNGPFYLPTAPGGGRIARSVDAARAVVAANPASPDLGNLPSEPFGKIEFSDGRIVVAQGDKDREVVTSLSGNIDWSSVNRAGKLTTTGIWRGESVNINLSSPNPLVLFAGGAAPVSFALKSNPTSATFEGTVNTSADSYLDGQITFNAPSLRRLLEWSQSEIAPKTAIGSIAVSGRLTGNAQRAKFEDAELTLDGNPGMGVLDVSLAGKVPSIAGTLAFETLDLKSFIAAFTPLTSGEGGAPGAIDTKFADQMELDLRLSAARATAGSIGMTEVAATAQVKNGLAVLDISDATAFGGTVQAGIRLDHNGDADLAELRMLATDIDGAIFGAATGMTDLTPTGRGTISIILKGPARSWSSLLENADGSISANFGAGELKGIDLPAFLTRASQGGFFALNEVAKGSLPINSAELKAGIANGVVRIEKAEAKADGRDIWLSGLVPYVGGGLALSGKIFPSGADRATVAPEAAFFVGGSWSIPFISPILQAPPPPG
ncbi:membrane assembly protein AsmA [Mesorhizobium albiziae]|nr:membrane assembly protein AsmA [Mesorhizobium albiziae]